MTASPAEIVRTLSPGHRPAHVHTAGNETVWTVPAGTGADGVPLLLTRDDGALAQTLNGSDGDDTAVALHYRDEPPFPDAPSRGSGWICGWARPIRADRSRAAALRFSDTNPLPELLDVGRGFTLWEGDVDEVRWERGDRVVEIPSADYAGAEPDPWYGMESDLLLDLYDHHHDVLDALRHRVRHVVTDADEVLPVRIDRYGVTVRVGDAPARHYLVRHRHAAANPEQLLCGMTGCRCRPHG